MSNAVKYGFSLEGEMISLTAILPGKPQGIAGRRDRKYAAVRASIKEVGVIEPPVVYPLRGPTKQYLLLDGHLRLQILEELGATEAFCLIANDDESYTYNHQVCRLTPIQVHRMIRRALERGVSEERIARALQIEIPRLRDKCNLLNGICDDAVNLLKEAPIGEHPLRLLRRVKPPRQVEIAELMLLANTFNEPYILALIAATAPEMRNESSRLNRTPQLNPEELARLQREMESLQADLRVHEDSYGQNFLTLVVVQGYLSKMLHNARVVRYLYTHHSDYLAGFQQIVEATSLEG